MAAFTGTPTSSAQYTSQAGAIGGPIWNVGLKAKPFTYTHLAAAGAGTGEVNLLRLPPGRLTIFSQLSRIEATQMVATADLHLGFRAYTEPDGDAVAEDDNAFLDNADAGGGAISSVFLLPAVTAAAGPGITQINSRNGFILYAMVDTANIEEDDTISGYVVWAQVG